MWHEYDTSIDPVEIVEDLLRRFFTEPNGDIKKKFYKEDAVQLLVELGTIKLTYPKNYTV